MTENENIKLIPLSQGKFAIVDAEDFIWLNQWKWHYNKRGYAMTHLPWKNNKREALMMHRVIMQAEKNKCVDHINGVGLDNQKSNLRVCVMAENQRNRKFNKNNTSGYKGVFKNRKKWSAVIRSDSKEFYIGRFDNAEDAAIAYDTKALEIHGEFAKTNKMLGLLK